jgi:probable HAF family extracellular repeat protein
MNFQTSTRVIALALFAPLTMAAPLAAQNAPDHPYVHHYKLANVGTFGGPDVSLAVEPIAQILNNRGTLVGEAETTTVNPDYPNGNPFVGGGAYVGHAFSWKQGVLTDLGTLPGGLNSGAVWINNAGIVAGISEDGEIDPLLGFPEGIAVLWKDGKITSLGTLDGGYESVANAVNDRGQVTGPALNTVPDQYSMLGLGTQTRAFLWENGAMRDLGTLGGPDAFAIYINDHSEIAGQSYTNAVANPVLDSCGNYAINVPTQDPFLWRNGEMIDIGTLGGTCGSPNGLNNRGEVVGQSDVLGDQSFHAFLWRQRRIRDLGTFGGSYSSAIWINDAGEIVGSSTLPGDQILHGFFWKDGAMADLGALEEYPCSAALAINSSSQVVGNVDDCISVEHASLWSGGRLIDLNVFVPPDSGVVLEEADFINDQGEIIGYASLANGDEHGYMLIPCDENHPDVEGCDYSLVDVSAAASLSPVPLAPRATTTNRRNSFGHTLPQRLGFTGFKAGSRKAVSNNKPATGPEVELVPH